MVKLRSLLAFLFLQIYCFCLGQQIVSGDKILLTVALSKDTVVMEDSLKVSLSLKNISNDTLTLDFQGRVAIHHYNDSGIFINYGTTERIAYILREFSNRNRSVWLKPGEEILETFDITAKESFFYKGENTLRAYYRNNFDDPREYKKRKKQKGIPKDTTIIVHSPPFRITVKELREKDSFN